MNMHRNKSRFFRFLTRIFSAKKAAAAPAFLIAAGLASFSAVPANAATSASITEDVTSGEFTVDNLSIGSGKISFGGTATANAGATTLLTGTQLTIESSGSPLDFGRVQFQSPNAGDSITVAATGVKFAEVKGPSNIGSVTVNEGAQLTVTGEANLAKIEASGELNLNDTATIQNLVAKNGAEVTLAKAGGVNALSMQGGNVTVKEFALDHVRGSDDTSRDASGTISASGALTVKEAASLTAENLNLETQTGGSIALKEGSSLDLGSGNINLAAGTSLTIGDASATTKSESLTANSLTADTGATTTLNGGTLTLTGDGIAQSLDSLADSSTGTVSVSGENATAKFSSGKTFAGELNLKAEAGTLEVADNTAVSTAGSVSAKNLTIGSGTASVKAKSFTLSEDGTLTMSGGKLDLSDTNGAETSVYGIADGSSGEITEGKTAGTITLNKSATAGALKFTATNGTLKLADQGDGTPLNVSTTGDVNVRNLALGKNTLDAGAVTVQNSGTGTGLTIDGGTLLGTSVKIKSLADNANGKIAAKNNGTIEIDLNSSKTTGELKLGDEGTQKIWIRGNGVKLGAGSVVTATGENAGSASYTTGDPDGNGLIVGAKATTATVFDLSAEGIVLNVNAVAVYCNDTLKLSGNQVIGSQANVDGKITFGVANGSGSSAGKITTTGTLKSLGQTVMSGGIIESTGADVPATEETPAILAIELGNVSMSDGKLYAQNGTVKVAEVSDQGEIAAKNVIIGSISDSAAKAVKIAQSKSGDTAAAADSVTFTGPKASELANKADSSLNTKKLALGDGVSVTVGSDTNKDILTEESLNEIELGSGATLTTTSNAALANLTAVSLAAGEEAKQATWTHNNSDITINGTLDMGDKSKIETDKNFTLVGTATLGDEDSIISTTGNIDIKDKLTAGDDLTLKATTGSVTVTGTTEAGDNATLTAGTTMKIGDAATDSATFGSNATLKAGTDITATGTLELGNFSTVTSAKGDIDFKGVKLVLGNNGVSLKTENAAGKDIKFGQVAGFTDDYGNIVLPVASVNATGKIEFHNSAADIDVQAGLALDAKEIVVEDGAYVQIINGYVNKGNTLTKVSVGKDATFGLYGNNTKLSETPTVVPHVLTAVELADGGTLIVGGKNPLGDNTYVTTATATTIKNSAATATGTVKVDGSGKDALGNDIHSTLTAETVGDAANGGVNVEIADGGELIATGKDASGVGIYVASLSGNGALTASDEAGNKSNIYITASNDAENIAEVAFTAKELRITDLDPNTAPDVEVTIGGNGADLSEVDSLVVADASAATDTKAHSKLTLTGITGEDGADRDWTHLSVTVGDTSGLGELTVDGDSAIETGAFSISGENSKLTIDDSVLVVKNVNGDFVGKLALNNNGVLTVREGDLAFTQDLVDDSKGTIETLGDGSSITFKGKLKNADALTLTAGATYNDEGELDGATGTLTFKDDAALTDGSEINAKNIVVDGTSKTVDASNAAIDYLENVTVSGGSTLKTNENFTGADDAREALKNVSLAGNGTFENEGDIRIEGAITDGGATPASASGTIQGTNVSIDLSKQTQALKNSLDITATADEGGTITLDGTTAGETEVDAKMTAKTLVIGSDTQGETTQVKITSAGTTLKGIASDIEIKSGDTLHIVDAWAPEQSAMTVTNKGTLTLDGALTVATGKDFTVAGGKAEFKGGVGNNGDFALTDAVEATAKTWTDATGSTLSIAGTEATEEAEAKAASLTISEGDTTINGVLSADNATITQTKGSLTIAGGAGETVDKLSITTEEADKTITFSTNEFTASGKVSVKTTAGTTPADAVNVEENISLGDDSSIDTTTLSVADGKTAAVDGKINVSALNLNTSGKLTLDGADVSDDNQDSTFKTLTHGNGSVLNIKNGATLTQDGNAALELNGTVNVAGTSDDKALFSVNGDTVLKSTGTIALSDYGVFNAEEVTVKLENGAQISLASGAVANIKSLDLSAVDMTTTGARAAVSVDGAGTAVNDAATITVDVLTIGNGEEKNEGTIQLTNGGKFYAKELAGGSSITLTEADGNGNVWLDDASQFVLGKGNLLVTESTRGEIIAEAHGANVEFDTAGKDFKLSGIGTENLVIGKSSDQTLDVAIVQYYDDTAKEYTYSKVNVRNKTTVTNGALKITDALRNHGTEDYDLGDLGNATFDNATFTVTDEQRNAKASVLKASKGLALINDSTAEISKVELTGTSNLKVDGSSLSLSGTKVSGFESIVTAGNAKLTFDGVLLDTDVLLNNSASLEVKGDDRVNIAANNKISVNGGKMTLGADIVGDGSLVLNGGTLNVAEAEAEDLSVANLAVEKTSTLNADGGDELSVTNASVAMQQELKVSGVELTVEKLDLSGTLTSTADVVAKDLTLNGGTLDSDGDITVTNAIADATGVIDGKNVTLNGLTEVSEGSVALSAEEKLTLAGTTVAGDVEAGTLEIVEGAETTLNGSVFAGSTRVTGTLNLSEADADAELGTVTVYGEGVLNISDCALVTGDIGFDEAASGAKISITDSTVDGNVALDGENNTLSLSDAIITGYLTASSGKLKIDGTNTAGTISLDGATIEQASGSTLSAETVDAKAYTLEEGATVTADVTIENGPAVIAGTVDGDLTLNNVAANTNSKLSGNVIEDLNLNKSTLTLSGSVGGTTTADKSTLVQKAGTLGEVSLTESVFEQSAGAEAGAISAKNMSEVFIAGTAESLFVSDSAGATVSGTITGTTTLEDVATLVQTGGKLAEVFVNDSGFEQKGGTASKVALTSGSILTQTAGTINDLEVASGAEAKLAGTTTKLAAAGTVTATADQTFETLTLNGGSVRGGEYDITVNEAVANASGSVSGKNVTLNGGLTGSASLTAKDTLKLAGTTNTSGTIEAKTLDVTGTLTANSSQIIADTKNVNGGGSLNLTVNTGLVSGKFTGRGTTLLVADKDFTLSLNGGNGNIFKTGTGTTSVSGEFDGTVALVGADASLAGTLKEVLFDGGTLTAKNGVSVANLSMNRGSVLEIGGKTAAATASVGTLTEVTPFGSAMFMSASDSSITVAHDVYSATEYDKLNVSGSLSNAVALLRTADPELQTLLGADGVTLDLISGMGTGGYTEVIAGDNFDATNLILSSDGRSVQVALNYRGAARGFASGFFNSNQRSTARALENVPATTDFVAALGTLNTYQTADALDTLGAVHTVSMMPAQIDAMWAHQSSVMNAIGTGSWLDYQYGKPAVHTGAWLQYVGSYDDTDSSAERKSWKRSMSGGLAGFEHAFSKDFLAGVALGYEYSTLRSNGNKITADSFHVDVFAKHRVENFEQRAVLSFARYGYDANRTIAYGSYRGDVSGSTDGFTAAFDYEAAYNFKFADWVSVAPVASVSAAVNRIDAWTEFGASAALEYGNQTAVSALVGVGARAEFSIPNPSYLREDINLGLSAMFTTDLGDRSSDIDAKFAGTGSEFDLRYDETKPYALRLGATLSVPLTNRCALFGGVSAELRDEQSGVNGNVGVRIGW